MSIRWQSIGNILVSGLAAVLLATVLGAVIQSQYNLAGIAALDVPVPLSTWIATTLKDIVGFGMLYGLLVAVAFFVALPVAAWLSRRFVDRAPWIFMLAGGAAVAALLLLLKAVLPMTAIAATRDPSAVVLMALAGVPAGWVYYLLRWRRQELIQSRAGTPSQ